MKKSIAFASIVVLSGCLQNTVEMTNAFNPNAGTYILANGTASINGQGFMRQAGGGVVTCAGENVELVPATAYQEERIKIIYGSTSGGSRTSGIGDVPPPIAAGAERLKRTTQCDAAGNFEFNGLAAGDYYVHTEVRWIAGQYSPQGGVLAKRIKITNGQRAKIILN
ncbi:MAG: hypothetical protein Q4G26_07080 [Paracoccus sp. (in: a-proteobacteria)]|nr:hypothetical protein [Paracoccus sp. (in: a-proteobacteria)]